MYFSYISYIFLIYLFSYNFKSGALTHPTLLSLPPQSQRADSQTFPTRVCLQTQAPTTSDHCLILVYFLWSFFGSCWGTTKWKKRP